MRIGVPRERKNLEKRVAITPDGAAELVRRGHKVFIELDAGGGSGFGNDEYRSAGCSVTEALADVWNNAELLVKVKEPDKLEEPFFRRDLVLFDYLHLASLPALAAAMLKSEITSFAYELVQTREGRLPLLEPMSEIAGKLSVLNGANYLLAQNGGEGLLLARATGVVPARVLIIGAGVAGTAAAKVALGVGAEVIVLDKRKDRLDQAQQQLGEHLQVCESSEAVLQRELARADLVVGAVLVPGASAPRILTREMIRRMKPRAVFVDISIDQGGCAETSKPTSLEEPIYVEEGVIHYGVCNMPAQVPKTSTRALTAATLPFVVELASTPVAEILRKESPLSAAVVTHQGKLMNKAVAESLHL